MFFYICGICGLSLFTHYIGVIDRGPAKWTFIFGIGKLDTAFNTVQILSPLIAFNINVNTEFAELLIKCQL